jgi:hypothetical protein
VLRTLVLATYLLNVNRILVMPHSPSPLSGFALEQTTTKAQGNCQPHKPRIERSKFMVVSYSLLHNWFACPFTAHQKHAKKGVFGCKSLASGNCPSFLFLIFNFSISGFICGTNLRSSKVLEYKNFSFSIILGFLISLIIIIPPNYRENLINHY